MPNFAMVVDVTGHAEVPGSDRQQGQAPSDWKTWDNLFQTIRDAINEFIDVANLVPGIDLEPPSRRQPERPGHQAVHW